MSHLASFRSWFTACGGSFHPSVVLNPEGQYGISVLAPKISEDTTIVTCPFSLIITKDTALHSLQTLLGTHASFDSWSERQLICSYLSLHRLFSEQSIPQALRHLPYIKCLPPTEKLSTPLHFTDSELEILKGTNLYGATLDRMRDWRVEWTQCQSLIQSVNQAWGEAFTWEIYLTSTTHLSSRAFPSSLLSPNPSLLSSTSSYPVLIPGVELLNHKRAQPVSWIVSCQENTDDSTAAMTSISNTVSILIHYKPESASDSKSSAANELEEVFNNYGPKANDELILGFGFCLPDNPDDKITLQIGGSVQKWEVGRNAFNIDGLWFEVRNLLPRSEFEFERDLQTADVLSDMVEVKLDKMKTVEEVRNADDIRPAVRNMIEHYIAGQRDILVSILEFSERKRETAIDAAREQGVDLDVVSDD